MEHKKTRMKFVAGAKIKICHESGCRNVQTTKGYCRLHYLTNWKKLKVDSQRKAAEKLNKYVEGICKKYPDRYMEVIRKDLRGESEVSFSGEGHYSHDEMDSILNDLGIPGDDNLDKILSHLKIDKGY